MRFALASVYLSKNAMRQLAALAPATATATAAAATGKRPPHSLNYNHLALVNEWAGGRGAAARAAQTSNMKKRKTARGAHSDCGAMRAASLTSTRAHAHNSMKLNQAKRVRVAARRGAVGGGSASRCASPSAWRLYYSARAGASSSRPTFRWPRLRVRIMLQAGPPGTASAKATVARRRRYSSTWPSSDLDAPPPPPPPTPPS
jgi:hypothetical protein